MGFGDKKSDLEALKGFISIVFQDRLWRPMEMLCFFHVSGWLVCWCLEARTDLCLNLSSIYSLNLFKTRSSQFPIETRIIWVLGKYIYIYISINNMIYAFTHLWVIQILLLKHFSDGSYHFFGIPPQNTFFLLLAFYLFLFASKKSRLFIWCRFFLANLSGLARIVKVTFCTIILQRINGQPAPVALCSLRRSLDFLSTSQAFFSVFFF